MRLTRDLRIERERERACFGLEQDRFTMSKAGNGSCRLSFDLLFLTTFSLKSAGISTSAFKRGIIITVKIIIIH